MQWINKVSIKTSLLVNMLILGGLLIFILAISIFFIYQPEVDRSKGLIKANQLADEVISATAEQAKERGFSANYIALLKQGKNNSDVKSKISNFRQAGDPHVEKAFEIAEALAQRDWGGGEFKQILTKSQSQWTRIQQLRGQIDNNSALNGSEWIKEMSEFIRLFSQLRQIAFAPSNHLEGAIYNNSIIKQAIWVISEYSGRERAIIATAIANKKPLTMAQRERLANYRGLVEFNLDYIKSTALLLMTNQKHQMYATQVQANWQAIQSNFLGSYEQLRRQVYNASESGNYPVSSAQWLSQATSAINSILKFNEQISADATRHSEEFGDAAELALWQEIALGILALGLIAGGLMVVSNITNRITHLKETFVKVVENKDVTIRVENHGTNEISELSAAFNSMIENLDNLIISIHHSSDQVSENVRNSTLASETTNKGMGQQERDIEQVATATTQMVSSIQSISDSTQSTALSSTQINKDVKQSGQLMQDTASAIQELGERLDQASQVINQLAEESQEIGQVLDVIRGIAEQTNLLALNAAIEAARAGEQGRGFAVVADEVRTLAGKTHESTEEIQRMIEGLQNQSSKATEVMQASLEYSKSSVSQVNIADETLSSVVDSMSQIMEMNSQIAVAIEQQGSVANEIHGNISSLQSVAEENRIQSQNSVNSVNHISEEMHLLAGLVKEYRSSHN